MTYISLILIGAVCNSLLAEQIDGPDASTTQKSWPMFRGGPDLLGVAAGKLDEKLKLLWKFETAGPIISSAVIVGDHVVVGSGDGFVYALNRQTGKKIWSYKTEYEIEATPCILDGSVYVGSADAFLYAIDLKKGTLNWKYPTDDKILGAANWIQPKNSDHPWILVGSYDSLLHCVDAKTGQAVWTYESDNFINGAPVVGDGKIMFGGCDALLHVVSAQ
ncbi:MAG: PQQ-like beta-propeller repeat protein, partial [Planctomycetes bacterium]|nr:PQQ-like beta-propeller repeat protein [Planctomycetota bacterium]